MKKTFILLPVALIALSGCIQKQSTDIQKPLQLLSSAVNDISTEVDDLSERVNALETSNDTVNSSQGIIARVEQNAGKLNISDSEGAQFDTINVYEDGLTAERIVSFVSPNKQFLVYGFWKGDGGIFSMYDTRDKTSHKIENVISNIKPAVWLSDNRFSFYVGCITPVCHHYVSMNSDAPWIFKKGSYKTYINDDLKIQLDIPEHWKIREEVSSDNNIVWNRGIAESRPEVSHRDLKNGETLETLKQNEYYIRTKDVIVDGVNGFEWECSGMLCVGVDVINNSRVYTFSLEIIRDEEIFSSIKFID
jgi:outer membrane murein-binding lipoprotein Lpp